MATLNLFVKLQFRFFGQGPTLNETTNETVTSFYFKVSILHYGQTNPDIFETTYFLTRIGLASTRNQWIRSQKPPLSRAVKDPVRVHTSLLESSSNARLWWGALRDDTKNRCVTHYVHMNPEKLCRFKNGQIRVNMALAEVGGVPLKRTRGDTSGFPLYPAGSECGGALWIVVPLCRKDLWKEAVAHFKYRRLHRQHPGPTHKNESFITHDLICIWSFFSVLTIFIDFFFLWEISYPDGGARAKNRANTNRKVWGEQLFPIPLILFGFRLHFTMWTLGNKLVLNFVVCWASLRLWKDSMQFFYVENNIDNNHRPFARWRHFTAIRPESFGVLLSCAN